VARNPRAATLLTTLENDTERRYQSVIQRSKVPKLNQDSSVTLRGMMKPRHNILKSIHKIEEISAQASSKAELFPTTLETDRSVTQIAVLKHIQSDQAKRRLNLAKNDRKVTAKVLYNIKETNVLDRLLKNS